MRVYAGISQRRHRLDDRAPRVERPLLALGEDDPDIREALAVVLSHDGFEVAAEPDGERLVDMLSTRALVGKYPDVVVVDHRMPGYTGLEILEGLKRVGWNVPVIVITAYSDDVEAMADRLGAGAIFQKPFDIDDLRTAILYVLGDGGRSPPARGPNAPSAPRRVASS